MLMPDHRPNASASRVERAERFVRAELHMMEAVRPVIRGGLLASAALLYVHALTEVFALRIVGNGPLWQWCLPAIAFGIGILGGRMPLRPWKVKSSVVALISILAGYGVLYAQRASDPMDRVAQGQLLLSVYALLVAPSLGTLIVGISLQLVTIVVVQELSGGPPVINVESIPTAILAWIVILMLGLFLNRLRLHITEQLDDAQRLADLDPLTGLLNRRALEQHVHTHPCHNEAQRAETAHSRVLVIDLDGFKHVNDDFGHAAGDQLLQRVADLLRESVRAEDAIGRIGGDEFLILLTDTTQAATGSIVQRLLAATHEAKLPVRMSIGVATLSSGGFAKALRDADTAMYAAKRKGGDRVEYAPSLAAVILS